MAAARRLGILQNGLLVFDNEQEATILCDACPPGFASACTAVPDPLPTSARWVLRHRGDLVAGASLVEDPVAHGGSQPWPFPHQFMVGSTAR